MLVKRRRIGAPPHMAGVGFTVLHVIACQYIFPEFTATMRLQGGPMDGRASHSIVRLRGGSTDTHADRPKKVATPRGEAGRRDALDRRAAVPQKSEANSG